MGQTTHLEIPEILCRDRVLKPPMKIRGTPLKGFQGIYKVLRVYGLGLLAPYF